MTAGQEAKFNYDLRHFCAVDDASCLALAQQKIQLAAAPGFLAALLYLLIVS
jgi:hypothetical protein